LIAEASEPDEWMNTIEYIALFKGVRYSEGAEHPTVSYTPVSHSIKKRYIPFKGLEFRAICSS
jgi:hypothetical protein